MQLNLLYHNTGPPLNHFKMYNRVIYMTIYTGVFPSVYGKGEIKDAYFGAKILKCMQVFCNTQFL